MTLKGLEAALKYIRKEISEEIPIRHLEILLYLNRTSEVSVIHLAKDLEIPKSAVSIAVRRMSQFEERNAEGNLELKGLGLLDKERDLQVQTLVRIKLTDKGKRVMKGLEEVLNG